MAESVRTLRRRLRHIDEDIAGCNDRIGWYERRLGELNRRRDAVLTELGEGNSPSREEREEAPRRRGDGGRSGVGTGSGLAGLAGLGGLSDLLANVDPNTLSKAVGMIGPLLSGNASGGASGDTASSGDDGEDGAEEGNDFGDGSARASPGGDTNILQLISRVANNVGQGGSRGGGGPQGDPLDGIAEVLDFVKAGHFKTKSLNMDDVTALVNLGRSPGVRSLVGTVSQLAAGVAAFNQLKKAIDKTEGKKPKSRQKPGPLKLPAPEHTPVLETAPEAPLSEAPATAPEVMLKLAPRSEAPRVAVPVKRRVT